ncbi:unnamed protein product [Candidula unifasciata]|uniref:Transmembrane protein 263 n=1 Tax=Candidula unifasciata TaxID=100452 RepID=A0A8S3YDF7_9EUPU|nr:unnamed protein product [Candidula unifasciata]
MSSEVKDKTSYSSSDKKTDDTQAKAQPTGGLLWRMSTGLVSSATGVVSGAVGYGVSGAKWVAGKTVDAGSAIASTTLSAGAAVASKLPLPTVGKKDKKE